MLTLPAHIERIFAQNDKSWNCKINFGELSPDVVAELAKANGKLVMLHITLSDDFTDKEKEAIEAAQIISKHDELHDLHGTDDKKDAFIEAYIESGGVILKAVRKVGISNKTFYNWMRDDAVFADSINALNKSQLWANVAEESASDLIKERNPAITIFTLKAQAGWKETQRIEQETKTEPITIEIVESKKD